MEKTLHALSPIATNNDLERFNVQIGLLYDSSRKTVLCWGHNIHSRRSSEALVESEKNLRQVAFPNLDTALHIATISQTKNSFANKQTLKLLKTKRVLTRSFCKQESKSISSRFFHVFLLKCFSKKL